LYRNGEIIKRYKAISKLSFKDKKIRVFACVLDCAAFKDRRFYDDNDVIGVVVVGLATVMRFQVFIYVN